MNKLLIPSFVVFALLAGCDTKQIDVEEDGPPTDDMQPMVDNTVEQNQTTTPIIAGDGELGGANANAVSDELMSPQALLDEKESPLATRVLYFEFNSAKVDEASLALLETHGEFISDNGNVHVRLEGHADERGSREFNVALGDRRNQSVRRLLLFQGASTDQIDTVSYGEELPSVLGHNEEAWGKNRRVELIYEVK